MSNTEESSPLLQYDERDEESSYPPSETLTCHEKAAWIIDETTRGNNIASLESVPPTRTNRTAYLFFVNTSWIRKFVVLFLIFLSFFELPSWCSAMQQCKAPDGSKIFLSGVPFLSPLVSMIVNALLLSVLIGFSVFDFLCFPVSLHAHSRVLFVILTSLVVDAFYVMLYGGYPPIRCAPFLRAVLPLFYWHSFRECAMSSFAVIGPFFDVVFFVVLFTLLFGWVVTLFFHDVPAADRYFGNLSDGIYSAFTSLTTADWPMQIVGVLDVSRASSILFIGFIVIGVFFLLNVLLAVVYNAYTANIENLVLEKLKIRRLSVGIAYDVLRGDSGSVTFPDIKLMFTELRRNKRHGHLSEDTIDMVFTALDDDGDNVLSREEFLDIIDILELKFIVELESPSALERLMPRVYETDLWQRVAAYVRSNSFNYLMIGFMFFNVVVVFVETTMDLKGNDTATSVLIFSLIECAFSFMYILEMILKIASLGFPKYWSDFGNQFDFWVTWLLFGASIYVLWPYIDNDQDIVRMFILLRCLRLFTLLANISRFRRLVRVFSVLIPASVPLFSLFFLSIYGFAAFGTEAFGGLIYSSNPELNPDVNPTVDAYVSNDYWVLNFNDMASGWFTLFCSVIVGYLTEIAEAITVTSKYGEWTKWYFICSFIVNTLIVSNCVVAFVVDLFVMEDDNRRDESVLLNDLQARYGTRRVQILQQKSTAHQVYATMFRDRINTILGI